MLKSRTLFAAVASALLLSATIFAADSVKLDGVKCLLNPKGNAKSENSVDYKGGKVYFCCGHCKENFAKNTKKFAAQANAQLVSTKQAKQTKCPLMGKPCKDNVSCKVAGVDVKFCCPGCVKKVAKLEGKEQVNLVFGEKAFAKGFEVVKKKK